MRATRGAANRSPQARGSPWRTGWLGPARAKQGPGSALEGLDTRVPGAARKPRSPGVRSSRCDLGRNRFPASWVRLGSPPSSRSLAASTLSHRSPEPAPSAGHRGDTQRLVPHSLTPQTILTLEFPPHEGFHISARPWPSPLWPLCQPSRQTEWGLSHGPAVGWGTTTLFLPTQNWFQDRAGLVELFSVEAARGSLKNTTGPTTVCILESCHPTTHARSIPSGVVEVDAGL